MNRAVFYILSVFFSLAGYSQQIVVPAPSMSDRGGAVLVVSDTVVCRSSPEGYGRKNEFSAPKTSKRSFEKEHHSIWYKLDAQSTCTLSFTIIPDKIGDDYDFMFLECDSPCFSSSALKILRANISRNNKNTGSITGLSSKGRDSFVGQGPGNSFSTPVKIQAGHSYFLVVDNVYAKGGGHKIIFSRGACKKPPEKKSGIQESRLTLRIVDKETRKPLSARILLIKRNYPQPDDTLINNSGFLFIKTLDTSKYYKLKVSADSCLGYREEFMVYAGDTAINKIIELQKISPGKKIILDNIYFRGGSAVFLRKSYPALRNLVFILKENPQLEIEIQGHVNQPYNAVKRYKESYYQNLSEQRAQAVYDYLVKRGISGNRLTFKGFGYSMMIYPYAKTAEEMQQNRRVEILIKKM